MEIWQLLLFVIPIVLLIAVGIIHRRSARLYRVLTNERDLLQTLLDNIPDQIYFKDANCRFLRVSRGVARTLGVNAPSDVIGKNDFEYFAADDAKAFRADDERVLTTQEALRDRIERGTVNGVVTWMTTTKAPILDTHGNAIGLVGISRDITDRVRAEQNLRDLVSKARCILWNANVQCNAGKFIWRIDFHSSEQLRKELGLQQMEWAQHIHPEQLQKMDAISQAAMLKGDEGYNQEFCVTTTAGETRWINEDVRITKLSDDEWNLVGVALDITERKRFEQQLAAVNDKLARQASEDALTGLHNRRAILELAQAEWDRWNRFASSFSVLIVDVDDFKRINDMHGHQVGDAALKHVAVQLKASGRKVDCVGRYGGEEFVIVLPETSLDGAENLARKILVNLRETPFNAEGAALPITVSIGAAMAGPSDKNIAGLLHRADCALLAAKRAGKNCVIPSPEMDALTR